MSSLGRWTFGLAALLLGLAVLSMVCGSGPAGPAQVGGYVARVLTGAWPGDSVAGYVRDVGHTLVAGEPAYGTDPKAALAVSLRLPRTIAGVAVGLALGAAGVLLQAVTRNPLAETGLLGVNAGASLGVVVGITFTGLGLGFGYLAWALAGALVASGVVLLIASAGRAGVSPLRLLLAGAALGATFRGLTSYLLLTRQDSYDEYRFWVLGAMSQVTFDLAVRMLPVVLAGLVVAGLVVRPLSALTLGDDVARALGHRPAVVRVVVAGAVTVLTATSVALAGPIAFLGLVAGYVARGLAGARTGAQLVLGALGGAVLLLGCDVLARVVVRPYEVPVSVLLALVGAPVLVLLVRTRQTSLVGQGR